LLIILNDRKRDTDGEGVLVNTDHIVMAMPNRAGGKTMLVLSTREVLYVDETLDDIKRMGGGQ
jgi:DNA/RNA-binding domain of Phe-tRNA-synthetase-like protein